MSFDGTTEFDTYPARLTGQELLAMFPANYENKFGQQNADETLATKKRKKHKEDGNVDMGTLYNWKKKSIFFF